MPFCINENLFLTLNTDHLGIAIRLKKFVSKFEMRISDHSRAFTSYQKVKWIT